MDVALTFLDDPARAPARVGGGRARLGNGQGAVVDVCIDGAAFPTVLPLHAELQAAAGGQGLLVIPHGPVLVGGSLLDGAATLRAGEELQLGVGGPRLRCALAPRGATASLEIVGGEPAPTASAPTGRGGASWLLQLIAAAALVAIGMAIAGWRPAPTADQQALLTMQAEHRALLARVAQRESELAQLSGERDRAIAAREALQRDVLEQMERIQREGRRTESELREALLSLRSRYARAEVELAAARRELERRAGRRARFSEAVQRSREALYLVVVQRRDGGLVQLGTAFAVRRDGVLVTGAHVAIAQRELVRRLALVGEKAEPLVVMNHAPDRVFSVLSARTHPDYQQGRARSADVALLQIETGGAALPAVMTLAPRAELLGLQVGGQVGLIGFPGEVTDAARPIATFKRGDISRITTFDGDRGPRAKEQLIQHTAVATGGNSGSPLIDSQGRVVAVHSAGLSIVVQGEGGSVRLRPSTGIHFSVRADLIFDLLFDPLRGE